MGSSTQQTKSTTGPSNPAVNNLVTKLSTGLGNLYTPGQNLVTGPGDTTKAGWAASLDAASNPTYSSALQQAIGSFGNTAAGNDFGMNDPGYATIRQNVANDTQSSIDQAYNSAGVFGSDQNQEAAGKGVASALANLDYGNYQSDIARQQQAAAILPQLFSAQQLPASIQQSVGASQDAATQAGARGQLQTLADYIAAATGAAGASGQTTTTNTPTTPLWQSLLGLGLSAL